MHLSDSRLLELHDHLGVVVAIGVRRLRQLEGPFPFALTGVLASFLDPLARSGVPIFAISTFDTDYILVKSEHADAALEAERRRPQPRRLKPIRFACEYCSGYAMKHR